MKKIAILGKGVFGKAIASHLSKKGHKIVFDNVLNTDLIFICVPSYIFSETILKIKPNIKKQKIIICTKGFTSQGELFSDFLKNNLKNDFFFLYGPTLANELKKGKISGAVLFGLKGKEEIKKEIESQFLKIDLSEDIIGGQIAAALKNVINIFVGIVIGANYGQNTQAFVLVKSLKEITQIGIFLGGKTETFLGLGCVGDLFLNSRNKKFGIAIGKGKKLNDVIVENNYIPEGINTIKNFFYFKKKNKIKTPIIDLLYLILFKNYSIEKAIKKIN